MFYEAFANSYDEMINWESRLHTEQAQLKRIVKKHGIRKIVDAGCGTGIHAILLAKMGVDVIAVDSVEKMLEVARANAKRYEVRNIDFRLGEFITLSKTVQELQDCAICLGNSLPHLTDDAEIITALEQFSDVLKPGGLLVLQLVHFDHYLDTSESAVATTEGMRRGQRVIFRRHYEFKGTKVIFHISVYDYARRELIENYSTPLNAIRKDLLMNFMERVGYLHISAHRDLAGAPLRSNDRSLVIFASKPTEKELAAEEAERDEGEESGK